MECLCFNVRPGAFGSDKTNPWLDHRVRKVVAFALDQERYVQELLDGWGVLMNSPFPPASWAFFPPRTSRYTDLQSPNCRQPPERRWLAAGQRRPAPQMGTNPGFHPLSAL